MKTFRIASGVTATAMAVLGLVDLPARVCAAQDKPVSIADRRQLFVDDFLVAKRDGVEWRLHPPVPKEIVLVRGEPWEGSGCGCETLFRDGEIIRMYYIGADLTSAEGTSKLANLGRRPAYACYAVSVDGIHWVKPHLGLYSFNGSTRNNILLAVQDNFTPFKDANPDCRPDERYKAVGADRRTLMAFKSADGIHWSKLQEEPIITQGTFDTQNNAFWDPLRKQYWCYLRGFHEGIRDIRVATSSDFRHWTHPEMLTYPGAPDQPLYTNQIAPYYREPDLFLGFPTRYTERKFTPAALAALPDPEHRRRRMKLSPRYGTAITDGLLMSSRDGRAFLRWDEPFLVPGPQRRDNWLYGDCYQSLGMLETPAEDPTAPPELSLYASEDEWKGPTPLRRYTVRIDGFLSIHAREKRGEFTSKTLVFAGRKLSLNFATSAAGSVWVELEDGEGNPLPGFSLADCDEIFGDALDRTVVWAGKDDVSAWAGRPVRVRMALRGADIYSMKFCPN